MSQTTYVSAALASNGGSTGVITLATNAGFIPGCTIYLQSSAVAIKILKVRSLTGSTQVTVYDPTSSSFFTNFNASAYLVADSATLTQPDQANVAADNDGIESPLTTRGDVYSFSTQPDRLAVGSDGQVMTADSTKPFGLAWEAAGGSGITSFTAVGSAPSANGATVSGSAATLQPASATLPGLVTAGTQTLGGAKTLTGTLTLGGASLNQLIFGAGGGTGTNLFQVPTNQAAALAVKDSASVSLLSFDTTTGSPALTIAPATTFSKNVTMNGTFATLQINASAGALDFAQANCAIQFPNSSATALRFIERSGGTSYLTIDTSVQTVTANHDFVAAGLLKAGSGPTTLTDSTGKILSAALVNGTALGNLSGTNSGDVTLGAISGAASTNGLTLSGQVLNLTVADSTHGGVIAASGSQTLAPALTISGSLTTNGDLFVANSGVGTNRLRLDTGGSAATIFINHNNSLALQLQDASTGGNYIIANTLGGTLRLAVPTYYGLDASGSTTLTTAGSLTGPSLIVGGTADQAGGNLTIATGSGKGAGTPPLLLLQAPPLGSTGTALTTAATVAQVGYDSTLAGPAVVVTGGVRVSARSTFNARLTVAADDIFLTGGGRLFTTSTGTFFNIGSGAYGAYEVFGTNTAMFTWRTAAAGDTVESAVPFLSRRSVTQNATTPVTVTTSTVSAVGDNRRLFTNVGSGATQVVYNLPPAVVGLDHSFIVEDSGGMLIDANGTDAIRYVSTAGTGILGGAGGTITTMVQGAAIRISCHKAGIWSVQSVIGTIGAAATNWIVA